MPTQAPALLPAALRMKCPQCRRGDIFKTGSYNLGHFTETYENCPHCGAHYEPEPGFFTGAMYFSYAFSVAIFIVFGIGIFWLLHDPSISVYMVGVILPTILLIPLNFRYSRVLMLYLFSDLRFDPELSEP